MRRPYLAGSPKRNRKRLVKQSLRKRTCLRLHRSLSPGLPIVPGDATGSVPQLSAETARPNGAAAEAPVWEPMRCGFGAVRVGALLGRLRLHLQTERFLAVHRRDTLWERGCLGAALALAVIAAGMQEAELDARLSAQRGQDEHGFPAEVLSPRQQPQCAAGLQPGTSLGNTAAALKGGATSGQPRRDPSVAQIPQGDHPARTGLQNPIPPARDCEAGLTAPELKKQIPGALFQMAQANELSLERSRNGSFSASGSARGAR